LKSIIGQTRFEVSLPDGGLREVRMTILSPSLDPQDNKTWVCECTVERPDRTVTRQAYHIDSFHALVTAIGILLLEIEVLKAEFGDSLTFLGMQDLGIRIAVL
jgi:hypothetical protein